MRATILATVAALPLLVIGKLSCTGKTDSQPNPIASQYPTLTTGTINGTVAILPIAYSLARSIIPSQYPILVKAYQELLPKFPANYYPALLQLEYDHDIMSNGLNLIPDFARAGIAFPFVDRLNDGYTSMAYVDTMSLPESNALAISGAELYGEDIIPSTFNPPCNAYASVPGSTTDATQNKVYNSTGTLLLSSVFSVQNGGKNPYSLTFWKNITNQPQFSANTAFCDNFIRLYNSSVTEGKYAPTRVQGDVSVVSPLFAKTTTFKNVFGLRMDNAWIENNYKNCSSLQGYKSTGNGD